VKEIERKYLLKDSILSVVDEYALKKHKITQFYTIIHPLKVYAIDRWMIVSLKPSNMVPVLQEMKKR